MGKHLPKPENRDRRQDKDRKIEQIARIIRVFADIADRADEIMRRQHHAQNDAQEPGLLAV